ncbi:MAG: hypothetical protein HFH67_17730 [Lachnospiraceae bacterium]|nr:hypothetical protein [Lachnospiraceae bacterium]
MNKDAKKYYRDIKSVIPSGGHQEKRLIKDYKIRITELNEMKPDITYDELQQTFGTPIDIVTEYYEGADTVYIMQKIRTTRIIRFCIYCILILTLAGFAISASINIRLYHEIHQGIVTHEKTIIK